MLPSFRPLSNFNILKIRVRGTFNSITGLWHWDGFHFKGVDILIPTSKVVTKELIHTPSHLTSPLLKGPGDDFLSTRRPEAGETGVSRGGRAKHVTRKSTLIDFCFKMLVKNLLWYRTRATEY